MFKHLVYTQPFSSKLHRFPYSLFFFFSPEKSLSLPLVTFPSMFSSLLMRCQHRHPFCWQNLSPASHTVTAQTGANSYPQGVDSARSCLPICLCRHPFHFNPKNQPNHTLALVPLSRHRSPPEQQVSSSRLYVLKYFKIYI